MWSKTTSCVDVRRCIKRGSSWWKAAIRVTITSVYGNCIGVRWTVGRTTANINESWADGMIGPHWYDIYDRIWVEVEEKRKMGAGTQCAGEHGPNVLLPPPRPPPPQPCDYYFPIEVHTHVMCIIFRPWTPSRPGSIVRQAVAAPHPLLLALLRCITWSSKGGFV